MNNLQCRVGGVEWSAAGGMKVGVRVALRRERRLERFGIMARVMDAWDGVEMVWCVRSDTRDALGESWRGDVRHRGGSGSGG
jgi:hypothetical protein